MDFDLQHPVAELLRGAQQPDLPKGGQPVDREKVASLAREFESMLILQMIRQMRESMLGDAEEQQDEFGLGATTLGDTLDGELARALAAAGGVGMQRIIIESFEQQQKGVAAAAPAPTGDVGRPTAAPVNVRPQPHETGRNLRRIGQQAMRAYGEVSGTDAATSQAESRPDSGADLPAAEPGPVGMPAVDPVLPLPIAAPMSSRFGWRRDPTGRGARFHAGVDFKAPYGQPVPVVQPGRVAFAGEQGGYGRTVVVDHGGGILTRYAHLSRLEVRTGEELVQGQLIGRVGTTGRSTGPHLHFEVLQDGHRIDPIDAAERFASGGFKKVAAVVD